MQARIARKLAPAPKSTCELTHAGVLRLEELPDGRTSIEVVRHVNRAVQKRSLDLTAEEFAALDAGLNEIFGRTETLGGQLSLDLPRTRSESGPPIPLPRGPRHTKRRYRYPRRKGARRGGDV